MLRQGGKMALTSGAGRGLGVAQLQAQPPARQGAAVAINDGCAERACAHAAPHRRHLP